MSTVRNLESRKKLRESREGLRKSIREAREELRKSTGNQDHVMVRIYESPKKHNCTPVMNRLQQASYVKVICQDDHEIIIPQDVAFCSGLIRKIFDDGLTVKYRENIERQVRLPNLRHEIVERVFKYCFDDFLLNEGKIYGNTKRALFQDPVNESDQMFDDHISTFNSNAPSVTSFVTYPLHSPKKQRPNPSPPISPTKSKRVVFCTEISPKDVMETLMASHFLDIPNLLETTASMVAHYIDGVETLEGIPPDVVRLIYSHLSPEKLAEIEHSEMHRNSHPDLDTSDLWLRATERRGWSPCDLLNSRYHIWNNEVRETQSLLTGDNKDPIVIELEKDFPNLTWKGLYLQKAFQHELINFVSNVSPLRGQKKRKATNMESLMRFQLYCVPYIYCLTLTPSFVELSGLEPYYLIRKCPNLEYLSLSDHVMDPVMMENFIGVLRSGKIPKMNDLRLANCSLDDNTCLILLEYLTTENPFLERLDLSVNQLTVITLGRFAEYLRQPNCNLKYLSLRDNNLKSKNINAWEENQIYDDDESCAFGKILSSLKNNSSLTFLDLSHNYLNFCGFSYNIFEDFSRNESLVYLILGNNRLICDENSSQMFTHFFTNLPQSVAHLNLSYVGIDSFHIQPVYEASLKKPNLKHLCLSDNMLCRNSCQILSLILRNNTTLKSLNLSNNHIWDSGARILSETLGSNTTLVSLKLSRNRIGRAALDLVGSCVRNNPHRDKLILDLRSNGINIEISQQIQELLVNSKMNVLLSTI